MLHHITCHGRIMPRLAELLFVKTCSGYSLEVPKLGSVVQSVVNKPIKGHFVNCFSRFNTQYSDIFC